MNTNVLLLIAAIIGFSGKCLSSTITTLGANATFNVSTGQVVRVLHLNGYLNIAISGQSYIYSYGYNGTPGPSAGLPFPVVAGPAVLSVLNGSFCTIELSDSSASFVPSNAVVIPADSGGPVNIILESSTDLINWTAALPGTYGTSTTNRFFRVRAVRTQ